MFNIVFWVAAIFSVMSNKFIHSARIYDKYYKLMQKWKVDTVINYLIDTITVMCVMCRLVFVWRLLDYESTKFFVVD